MPDEATALKAISDDPEYQEAFKKAYGREMNFEDVGRAIGAFERTPVFLDSPLRRFLAGDEDAISSEARAGWELFNGKARGVACHPINPSNPLGTDDRFHNIGVAARHQNFESLARQAIKALAELREALTPHPLPPPQRSSRRRRRTAGRGCTRT